MFTLNWVIKEKLAGSQFPTTDVLSHIHDEGIRAILSLDYRRDDKLVEQMGFEHKTIYIRDYAAPTDEQFEEAIKFIGENIEAGRPVLVHCMVGQGRTGTVICAYMINNGMDVLDALEEVRACIPYAVEVEAQVKALKAYHKAR